MQKKNNIIYTISLLPNFTLNQNTKKKMIMFIKNTATNVNMRTL